MDYSRKTQNPPIWLVDQYKYGIKYDENNNLIESTIPNGYRLELRYQGVYKVVPKVGHSPCKVCGR